MRNIALVFFALALGCEVFAYWGLSTVSGRRAFDEMAGMIPLAVGVAGVLFAIGSLIAWWRYRILRAKARPPVAN